MDKIGLSFIYIATSQVITVLGGLTVNIFLSRYLGKEFYGQYSFIISGIIVLGLSLVSNGFPQTLSKYIAEEKMQIKPFASKILFFHAVESVIIMISYIVLSPVISFLTNEKILLKLIILAACIIPFQAIISFVIALNNGLRKFKEQAIIVSLLVLIKSLFVIFFAFFFSVEGAIFGFFLSMFIVAIALVVKSRSYYSFDRKFKLSKEIWTYFYRITFFSIEISLLLSIDLILLKFLLGKNQNAQLGIYNAGAVIAKTCYFLIVSFSSIMFPIISHLMSNNKKEEARRQIGAMIRLSSILIIPVSLIISSLSPVFINLFFKIEYSYAHIVTSILAIGYSLLGFFFIFMNILNSIGDVLRTNLLSSGVILVDILLLNILIKHYGIVGASIATAFASFIGCLLSIFLIKKKIGISVDLFSLIRINFVNIILFFLVNFLIDFFTRVNLIGWAAILFIEFIIYFLILKLTNDFDVLKTFNEYLIKLKIFIINKK